MTDEYIQQKLQELPFPKRTPSSRRHRHIAPRTIVIESPEDHYRGIPFHLEKYNEAQLEAIARFKIANNEERDWMRSAEEAQNTKIKNTAKIVIEARAKEEEMFNAKIPKVWTAKYPSFDVPAKEAVKSFVKPPPRMKATVEPCKPRRVKVEPPPDLYASHAFNRYLNKTQNHYSPMRFDQSLRKTTPL